MFTKVVVSSLEQISKTLRRFVLFHDFGSSVKMAVLCKFMILHNICHEACIGHRHVDMEHLQD